MSFLHEILGGYAVRTSYRIPDNTPQQTILKGSLLRQLDSGGPKILQP